MTRQLAKLMKPQCAMHDVFIRCEVHSWAARKHLWMSF